MTITGVKVGDGGEVGVGKTSNEMAHALSNNELITRTGTTSNHL
jgi:hypothetical protein